MRIATSFRLVHFLTFAKGTYEREIVYSLLITKCDFRIKVTSCPNDVTDLNDILIDYDNHRITQLSVNTIIIFKILGYKDKIQNALP